MGFAVVEALTRQLAEERRFGVLIGFVAGSVLSFALGYWWREGK